MAEKVVLLYEMRLRSHKRWSDRQSDTIMMTFKERGISPDWVGEIRQKD